MRAIRRKVNGRMIEPRKQQSGLAQRDSMIVQLTEPL
jgi:hypothetical protein